MSTATRMEPRLAARRVEVARDQGRRRLRRLLVALVVLAVVAGSAAATQSPLLDVDAVAVQGARATEVDAIRQAAGVASGTPLLSVDAGAAARSVEQLPWIASAEVSRSWSGTIQIRVRERVAVAVVGTGPRAVVVDGEGTVLAVAPDRPDLPVIAGAGGSVGSTVSDRQLAAVSVVASLPDELAAEVDGSRTTKAGVELQLDDGIEVSWGDASQADAKAESLALLLEQADRDTIATIDLTVPRAATLTRNNGGQ